MPNILCPCPPAEVIRVPILGFIDKKIVLSSDMWCKVPKSKYHGLEL